MAHFAWEINGRKIESQPPRRKKGKQMGDETLMFIKAIEAGDMKEAARLLSLNKIPGTGIVYELYAGYRARVVLRQLEAELRTVGR